MKAILTKKCTRCRKSKNFFDFKLRHNSNRLMPWCILCKRNYDRIALAAKRANAVKEQG